jgi:hypothetical protein
MSQFTAPAGALGLEDQHGFRRALEFEYQATYSGLGRRVMTRAQSPVGLSHQALLFLIYYNFCLAHASLRLPLDTPQSTRGSGPPRRWQERTPATLAPARKWRCGRWPDRPRLVAARDLALSGAALAPSAAACGITGQARDRLVALPVSRKVG